MPRRQSLWIFTDKRNEQPIKKLDGLFGKNKHENKQAYTEGGGNE